MRFIALSLALALCACSGSSKSAEPAKPTEPVVTDPGPAEPVATDGAKPTPSDAELESLFARTLDFFDALAAALETSGKDCKVMASSIGKVFDAHKDTLAEAKSYKGNAEVDRRADEYMQAHEDRLSTATKKMGAALEPCSNDPDIQAVMKRFDDES